MKTFILKGILLLLITVVATATTFECNATNKDFIVKIRIEDKLSHRSLSCQYLLLQSKDSNVNFVSSGIADSGEFSLKFNNRPKDGEYKLQIAIGDTMTVLENNKLRTLFNASKLYNPIDQDIKVPEAAASPYHMPPIRIGRKRSNNDGKVKTLDEVTVTATKVLFYHKGDTLFYNADAFVLAEGSMLDALLKQMPGVELNSNGVITVNGKRIDRLLLNGKDLFNGKHELMLENLEAFTVKDIAVYDKRSRLGELLDLNTGDEAKVMDVRLKRKYLSSLLGHAEAGYGTRSKYLAKIFAMWFSDNVSVSAYAGSNNLANNNRPGQYDSFASPFSFHSDAGTKTVDLGGFTYNALGFANKWELRGNADVQYENSFSSISSSTENFLTNGNTFDYRWNNNVLKNLKVETAHNFFLKLGSWGNLELTPRFSHNYDKSKFSETSVSSRSELANISESWVKDSLKQVESELSLLMNRMFQSNNSKNKSNEFSVHVKNNIKLSQGNNTRALALSASFSHSQNSADKESMYHWEIFNSGHDGPTTNTHYNIKEPRKNTSASIKASLEQFLGSYRSKLPISYEFLFSKYSNSSDVFSLLPENSDYSINDLNIESQMVSWLPDFSYNSDLLTKQHIIRFDIDPNINILRSNIRNLFLSFASNFKITSRDFDFISNVYPQHIVKNDFDADLMLKIQWGKYGNSSWRSDMALRYHSIPVNMYSLVNIPNVNPLLSISGNPDLKKTKYFSLRYLGNKIVSQKKYTLSFDLSYELDPQMSFLQVDESTGMQNYKTVNISDRISANATFQFFTRFGKNKRFYTNLRFMPRYSNYKDYSNSRVNYYNISEYFNLGWRIDNLDVEIFFDSRYDYQRYGNKNLNSYSMLWLKYGPALTLNLAKNWSIASKLDILTRRGYQNSNLNKTNFVWNATIGKSFFKGRLLFRLECYDILRQISNIDYSLNSQSKIERVSNFIPNYFLLQVRWNFR